MYPRFNKANHFTGFLLRMLYSQLAYPVRERGIFDPLGSTVSTTPAKVRGIYDPAGEHGIYDPLSFPPSSTVVLVQISV